MAPVADRVERQMPYLELAINSMRLRWCHLDIQQRVEISRIDMTRAESMSAHENGIRKNNKYLKMKYEKICKLKND